ncbi:type II and III secretion system protein family protein [Advenella mimigardefordensis]|uniref:Type IV pilus biogenesis and competence protein PilQ n=1 Tax=Advenella mimigardefordensis (strain DSM 17166 / LMG 22922 / DPN7) TaxID=1247726 RepID=W0PEN1_ADVMD|nr:pilus assembly protein N-terminal domain-containing protein [Advenella mimigardefordensis]AHG63710.1 putative type II/III secretion system protein [Advenella mimigardefordensis DPN7]
MKLIYTCSMIIALEMSAIAPACANESSVSQIALQVGDVKVVPFADLARVAVGDGKIVNAVTDGENELVLFAREPGQTVLNIWDKTNRSQQFHIVVRAAGEQKLQGEIRRMLGTIGRIRTTQVGDKIIVEGDNLSDADRERLLVLVRHFPQIVDMTSQIGWDQMVLLDVQILELPRNVLQELGVKWGTHAGGLSMGAVWDTASSRLSGRPGDAVLDIPFRAISPAGYFGLNALLSASLQSLAQEGQAVVLAQPQLMARSGATAEFLAGGEVPYVTTDKNGQNQTIFKPYGVSLHITPRIQKNGNVRSKIEVEVSSVDASMAVNGGPALKTRRTSTEFNVQSGQTLVLAGFVSRDQFRNVDKLPGVGDLPILGALFRSNRFQRNETELAIFVRPVVVSADNQDLQKRAARSRTIIDETFKSPPILNTPVTADKADESQAELTVAKRSYPIWIPSGQKWQYSRKVPAADSIASTASVADKRDRVAQRTRPVPIRVRHSRWKPVLRLKISDAEQIVSR